MAAGASIPIIVEFTYRPGFPPFGGLELLFGNERKHKVTLPGSMEDGSPTNIAYLLPYLVDNLMQDQRKEMFIMEDNVYVGQICLAMHETNNHDSRPGILVLINDADWELEGEEKYELQPGDNIVFVSTLHGG
ncbi:uncharacterized protein N7482_005273 [Penicillium canariense]|uniref:Ubiquitin-related modifier 1 n=1 Tax=Penicillium canariense TaxID=189055 RepID=A0A9W9I6A0_9EURO|nr:uncharacterized protein N7482_005273 [Penicillium canariense]KAJ5166492.1 hypothetical protein N7482_005273 [Penicillium canariense]